MSRKPPSQRTYPRLKVRKRGRQGETLYLCLFILEFDIDFGTFLSILTRPDGFKPAGSSQEFIQGFQVFDKEGDGYISAGELRYGK